jgi:nucleoside-triphosphatase THEP1
MKILLTGLPKSGKTTMLAKLIDQVANKRGLVAKEVRENDERIGFDLLDNTGATAPLARTDKQTPYPVGRYFVDVEALNGFIEPLFSFDSKQLLYIDEVGQMQLYSSRFKELVTTYLDAANDFLGTVTAVYKDDFVETVKGRPDILVCEITPDNRAEIEQGLVFAVERRDAISALPPVVQQAIIEMGATYLRQGDYVLFRKLFKNAVPYVSSGRIKREDGGYLVEGSTNMHHVTTNTEGRMVCDCDLFNGRGHFEGHAGECSHLQSVTLLSLTAPSIP